MTSDDLDALVLQALAPLESASAPTLYAFAMGLRIAEPPVRLFSGPIFDLALDVEQGRSVGACTRLGMRVALKLAALEGSLVAKLAEAEEPFWRAVGDAIAALGHDSVAAASTDGLGVEHSHLVALDGW